MNTVDWDDDNIVVNKKNNIHDGPTNVWGNGKLFSEITKKAEKIDQFKKDEFDKKIKKMEDEKTKSRKSRLHISQSFQKITLNKSKNHSTNVEVQKEEEEEEEEEEYIPESWENHDDSSDGEEW